MAKYYIIRVICIHTGIYCTNHLTRLIKLNELIIFGISDFPEIVEKL